MVDGVVHPAGPTANDTTGVVKAPPHKGRRLSLVDVAASLTVQFTHRWAHYLSWCLVVATHVGIVIAYDHEAFINDYILLGSNSEMALQLLGLGASIRREIGNTLIATNRILVAWHIYGAAQAVGSSLYYRRFVFRMQWRKLFSRPKSDTKTASGNQQPRRASSVASTIPPQSKTPLSMVRRAVRRVWQFYRSTGARGKHFDVAFDVREAFEIVSQTVQAYSISCLITNNSVLHFVSLVLVLNCWSTPILRLVFRKEETKKRLLCLAVDAVFDFCCALAIPFLTFSLWEHQVATLDFFDPVWLIRSSTLLQYNLVNTWSGVFTTRLPAFGLIMALETIKSLLHRHEEPPVAKTARKQANPNTTESPYLSLSSGIPVKRPSRINKMVDLVFFLYGLVVLILYAKAMAEPAIDQDITSNCSLQLRPWGRQKSQCAVLDIDCYRLGITGASTEISNELGAFDASVIASVTIANCPALEMPSSIQSLSRLLNLEVINSTLMRWYADAAVTRTHHPVLTGVTLIQVSNLKAGLPQGLLSSDFPPSLCVVQIIESDMETLTSRAADEQAIQLYWPQKMFVFAIERTQLIEFPRVLHAKTITQILSLAGNNLTAVPAEAFFSFALSTIYLFGGNPIQVMPAAPPPEAATTGKMLASARLAHTQIQAIPPWLASLYTAPSPSPTFVFAGGTPLCESGTAPSFVLCMAAEQATYFPLEDVLKRRKTLFG